MILHEKQGFNQQKSSYWNNILGAHTQDVYCINLHSNTDQDYQTLSSWKHDHVSLLQIASGGP